MAVTKTLQVPGYQVLEFLGSGAKSSIWRVRETASGEEFALKRVQKRCSADLRFLEQAQSEYEVGSQLEHPALRGIHGIRRRKRWFSLSEIHLIMEYCPGRTVQQIRPESMIEIARIFLRVADALAYMNDQGFVHGDMKPNNIILAPHGGVKVIDLGQSCPVGTIKKRIQGTPDFIAPEQVQRRPLDARTDVYNFGAALYWAMTGKPIPTVLPKRQEGGTFLKDLTLLAPEELNPAVPQSLSRLTMDCIPMQPSKRVASMREVRGRLDLISLAMQRNGNPKPTPLPGRSGQFPAPREA